uniref:Polygalacturonase n=1 Tax=Quercus lobata TaxID=97700 RepID=A0A7N2MCG8_QUELO
MDSTIATGDDCVSMSPGSKNINIRNVTWGPGHGISVGSLVGGPNEEDVSRLTVTNCTFIGTQNGLRVKTWARSYASNVFNLTFEDILWIMSTTQSSLINNIVHLTIVKRMTPKFRFEMFSTETLGAPLAQKLQLLLNVAKANLVERLSSTTLT